MLNEYDLGSDEELDNKLAGAIFMTVGGIIMVIIILFILSRVV